jgi:hypothetical protein
MIYKGPIIKHFDTSIRLKEYQVKGHSLYLVIGPRFEAVTYRIQV